MKEFKEKVFIDSNIFLRTLVEDNKKYLKECVAFLKFVENTNKFKAYISSVVVLEVGWVLKRYYEFSKKEINNSLMSVISIKNVRNSNKINFEKGLEIFGKYNVKLGDAMIGASDIIQKEKAIIVSYDKDFDKIKEVVRMTPREVLKKFKR